MSAARIKPIEPVVIRYDNSLVFYNRAGRELCIPSAQDVDYVAACQSTGKLLVDKSRYVALGSATRERWLPTVRRPKGFGKTMFLSLTEHFVDLNYRDDFSMPILCNGAKISIYLQRLPAYSALAVVHLDFAELPLGPAMSEAALRSACRSLLASAATACYHRYLLHFLDSDEEDSMETVDFKTLLELGSTRWVQFYVGIDNYTSPLSAAGVSIELVEAVIVQEILQPIFDGHDSGLIVGGFMVGRDVPGARRPPYCSQEEFIDQSLELSHDFAAFDLLGLRDAEVVAMGNALFDAGPLLLKKVRIAAGFPSADAGSCRCDLSYCTGDVLAIARAMQTSMDATFASLHVSCVRAADYPAPRFPAPLGDLDNIPSDIAAAVKSLLAAEAAQHTVPAMPQRPRTSDLSSLDSSPSLEDAGSSSSSDDSLPSSISSPSISSFAGGSVLGSPPPSKS